MLEPERPAEVESHIGGRADRLSGWSLLVLALVVIEQLFSQFDVNIAKFGERFHVMGKVLSAASSDDQPSRADVKYILDIDEAAKSAFASSYLAGATGYRRAARKQDKLAEAVSVAEEQLQDYKSDRAIARRVMILRAEDGQQPLMAVSADRAHAAIEPPLAAFDTADPRQRVEANAWRTLFSYRTLPQKTRADEIEKVILAHPSLGWYTDLALHQLWLRAGQPEKAAGYLRRAQRRAFESIAPLRVMYGVVLIVGLLGITMLIGLTIRAILLRSLPPPDIPVGGRSSIFDVFACPLPDRIAPIERKLGAGDLFDLFVLCMLLFVAISFAAEYVPAKVLFPQAFQALTQRAKINAVVGMVSGTQCLSTLLSIAIILIYARRRNASVAKEIGLTFDQPFKNVGVGFIGWGMSLPLIYAASSLALRLFPNLPDPSNPAIPLTTQSTGLLAHIALFVTICILAPIFEEIMFRGLFYQTARAKLGVWPAIILTGVVFGLVHPVSIVGSFPLMLLGSVFAWLAETRKSLLPGMVAHSLQNMMSFANMLFLS